ncbi:DUF397 domain-containing protein [Streptomyces sp. NPDC088766]
MPGGVCLEAATASGVIHVRDSKAPARAQLTFSAPEWTAFLTFAVRD